MAKGTWWAQVWIVLSRRQGTQTWVQATGGKMSQQPWDSCLKEQGGGRNQEIRCSDRPAALLCQGDFPDFLSRSKCPSPASHTPHSELYLQHTALYNRQLSWLPEPLRSPCWREPHLTGGAKWYEKGRACHSS